KAGAVHEGGRHLSHGLANLPEDAEYGLFGLSPAVQPDIAIITGGEAAEADALFEKMPALGTVIVNADDEKHLHVIARARPAGIETILTYGRRAGCDVQIQEAINAGNGMRLSFRVLGEEISCLLQAGFEYDAVLAAGLLTLKMTGKSAAQILESLSYMP